MQHQQMAMAMANYHCLQFQRLTRPTTSKWKLCRVWHGSSNRKRQAQFVLVHTNLLSVWICFRTELAAPQAPEYLNASGQLNDKNLITISMAADEHGRFGFNVRGGTDVNLPVLVARIAPHSPADRVIPKIKEGDQVVLINGHDVSDLTHNQVVNLIKETREHASNTQLVLVIKPTLDNECIKPTLVEEEEPICQYVPDNYLDVPKIGDVVFSQSLFLLRDGLASGALLEQFEQLYKTNANLPICEARKDDNHRKNRYRDILPCTGDISQCE